MKRFNGICIISPDVERLSQFYQKILQVGFQQDGDNYTFATEGAQLSIYSCQGMEQMAPGSMAGVGYGSYTMDFEVEDVDQEYQRLTELGVTCVKPPMTYSWGRRSTWFRDPDGNIFNFYSMTQVNP